MADFKDQSLWIKLAFLHLMVGFFCLLFMFDIGAGLKNASEACHIIGFLCYLTAAVLILCLVFVDEVNGNKIALICFIVFALIAGIATVIAIALWGNGNGAAYSTMVGVFAALLAILAGIFAILDVAGVKK